MDTDNALSAWNRGRLNETRFTRLTPRRFDLDVYLAMLHERAPERMRLVPACAIAEQGVDDEGDFSLVDCPCGAKPVVRTSIAPCGGCERWYAHLRVDRVVVVYGGMTPPG